MGAIGTASLAAPAASAATNSPTTRDCSLFVPAVALVFDGLDPDFIELSGVTVASDETLTATQNPVQLEASESADPGDNTHTVTLYATVSAPQTADQNLSGTGTGLVILSLPLASAPAGSSYTISWSATFDNGFHSCPGPVTPTNLNPSPFVVQAG